MNRKLISIKPGISKIWLSVVLSASIIIIVFSLYFSNYLGMVFIIVYFLALFLRQNCQLDIDTSLNTFTLRKNGYTYSAKLINCRQITFLLTIITLQYGKHSINLPIYMDSIKLTEYKNLRMFLQWN
jgi:hypothetical protein